MDDAGKEIMPIGKEGENKKPLNILLVEDEKVIVSLIKAVLNGHNVTVFDNAEQALEKLRKDQKSGVYFDWVITDKGLKGKRDGFGLVADIKIGNLGNPFVTMISGSASDIQRDNSPAQLKEKGIHQLMGKPFDVTEMTNAVNLAREFGRKSQNPQA